VEVVVPILEAVPEEEVLVQPASHREPGHNKRPTDSGETGY